MGTRGLLGVVLKNGRKRASYNHWDSHPSGLGVDTVTFIKSLSPEQIKQMAAKFEELYWIDESIRPTAEEQERYVAAGLAETTVSTQSTDEWYVLLRKVQGAAALPKILDGTLSHFTDDTDFAKNEKSCEWQYYIDWHNEMLHVLGSSDESSDISGPLDATAKFSDLSTGWMENLQEVTEA